MSSQLSSDCLPEFWFISQNWSAHCLQVSSICRPVFSQSSFKMLCPTRHLVVSRLSFKCGLPISSHFVPDVLSRFFPSCLRFRSTPTPPRCLPPADWVPSSSSNCLQLDLLDLNLTPSLLLVCTAGFIVSDSLDVFLYLPPIPLCLPLWPMASGLWMPVFTSLSLLVSQSGSRRLVVSGCPDVFSLHSLVSHHVSLTIFLRI